MFVLDLGASHPVAPGNTVVTLCSGCRYIWIGRREVDDLFAIVIFELGRGEIRAARIEVQPNLEPLVRVADLRIR